jgi:Ser-tRNA(Ala) deacylase AlaX
LTLYWSEDQLSSTVATVGGVADGAFTTDCTCFHPGGSGQPCDIRWVDLAGGAGTRIVEGADGAVWHRTDGPHPSPGTKVHLRIDTGRRLIISRYHTALHVLNTLVLRTLDGWVTGTRIGLEDARIAVDGFDPETRGSLATAVNRVPAADRRLRVSFVGEEEYRNRPELRRTLMVEPPGDRGPGSGGRDRRIRRPGLWRHPRIVHRRGGQAADRADRQQGRQEQAAGGAAGLRPGRP